MDEIKVIFVILLALCAFCGDLLVEVFRLYSKCFDLEFEINNIKKTREEGEMVGDDK